MNDKLLVKVNIDKLLADKFASYSKYIIQDRALPDVRDGLKPVQRRILFAMSELRIFANSQYKKSARIVGEVIGKYHPHGDTSVYDAIVRLAQDWKQNFPLIEMHGNKGSIDGDPAAAMRYTEIRLSEISSYILQDIDKATVPFVKNFDDNEEEPTVLPGRIPNLLVNGSIGIAAGYSTNIPPHNLGEVVEVVRWRIANPSADLEDLLKEGIIKGPDFPTGGVIVGGDGIRHAFRDGKGKILLRCNGEIDFENNRIVIHEIPYDVNKSDLIKSIDLIAAEKGIASLREVRDETDRDGVRIVLEFEPESNIEAIYKFLLMNTNLQISYSINMVAISNGKPKRLSLLEIIDAYIAHQRITFKNQFQYELEKAKKRLEIVDALIKVVSIIDEVIKIIRKSVDKADAKVNLIKKWKFTENQAEAIVVMRLYRLTSTDIVILEKERKELKAQIDELSTLLSKAKEFDKYLTNYFGLIVQKIESPRRTRISVDSENFNTKEINREMKKTENYAISVSNQGRIRVLVSPEAQRIKDIPTSEDDIVISSFTALSTSKVVLFTNLGNYLIIPVEKLKVSKPKEAGIHVNTYVNISPTEKIIASLVVDDFEKQSQIFLLATSANGFIKRTAFNELYQQRISKTYKFITLSDDDFIVDVRVYKPNEENIIAITEIGYGLKFSESEVPATGLKSRGVKLINLGTSDHVVGLSFDSLKYVLYLTSDGKGKFINVDDIPLAKRAGKGKMTLSQNKVVQRILVMEGIAATDKGNIFMLTSDGVKEIKIDDLSKVSLDSKLSKMFSGEVDAVYYLTRNEHSDLTVPFIVAKKRNKAKTSKEPKPDKIVNGKRIENFANTQQISAKLLDQTRIIDTKKILNDQNIPDKVKKILLQETGDLENKAKAKVTDEAIVHIESVLTPEVEETLQSQESMTIDLEMISDGADQISLENLEDEESVNMVDEISDETMELDNAVNEFNKSVDGETSEVDLIRKFDSVTKSKLFNDEPVNSLDEPAFEEENYDDDLDEE